MVTIKEKYRSVWVFSLFCQWSSREYSSEIIDHEFKFSKINFSLAIFSKLESGPGLEFSYITVKK